MKLFIVKQNILLFVIALTLSACSKGNDSILEQELQSETHISSDNETFVSLVKATSVATVFLSQRSNGLLTKSDDRIASVETIQDSKNNNEPAMYVINYEEIGGLVIWMEETKEAIRQSEDFGAKTKSQMRSLWRQYESITNEILPLVNTKAPTPEQDAARMYRVSELHNSGYTCYSLADAYANNSVPFLDLGSAYQYYWSIADSYNYPFEYTLLVLKENVPVSSSLVGHLLTTEWHQTFPFNAQWTSNTFEKIGCITVAMAQIMKFHQHPTHYNWNNMPDTHTATSDSLNSGTYPSSPGLYKDIRTELHKSSLPQSASAASTTFSSSNTVVFLLFFYT